jgi:hypothetical protein
MPSGSRKQLIHVIEEMNRSGWNIGKKYIWSSCLTNEIMLQEIENGETSREALCGDERFVMWDRYGLPLSADAYESADQAEAFLRSHCCFPGLLDSENNREDT